MTFVFDKAGALVFVANSADSESLDKMISTNGAQLPPPSSDLTQKSAELAKALDASGNALSTLIQKTHSFTVVNIEVGRSVGVCAPCTQRHTSLIDKAPKSFDASYVVIQLEDK